MYFLQILLLNTAVAGLYYKFDLALDYFSYRNVKWLCLMHCEVNGVGVMEFAKAANSRHMMVTVVETNRHNTSRIEKCLHQTLLVVGVVLDVECLGADDALLFASEKLKFGKKHMWLIIEESIITKDIILNLNVTLPSKTNYIETLNISVDADIVFASRTDLSEYILHEVYSFGTLQGGDLIVNPMGSWNYKSGISIDNINGYKYYRRWNFQQWQMRMIFVMSPIPKELEPSVLTNRRLTPGLNTITKTSAMVLHVIAEVHNFSFKYTVADRWIGTYETNSTRVVANSLYFREQDITPVLRYQAHLFDKLDVVYPPLTSIETRYFYRIPTKGPGKFENQFLRPLSQGAWLCVVAISVLCILILIMSASLERRSSSAQYAVFSVVASFCQQFFEDMGDDRSGISSAARKLTILVTGLSFVLIYNYYTSSVVSWLLSAAPPSITSLQELLDSPLELLFEDVGYTRSWLQTPNFYYNRKNAKIEDELRLKKVSRRHDSSSLLVPLDEGIARMKAGGYAYHTEPDRANDIISRTFTQSELCEIGSLQSIEKTQLFSAVQTHSPYKEFLSWSIIRVMERGVLSCIQRRTDTPSVECEGSSPRALALGGAAPAFILLASGAALAIAIMFVERWLYRRTDSGNRLIRKKPRQIIEKLLTFSER